MEMKSFLIKNLIDVSQFKNEGETLKETYKMLPTGIQLAYKKSRGKFHLDSTETPTQVKNSICVYNNPIYYDIHYSIKNILSDKLGLRLYPTYYFERVYLSGQDLKKHVDRPSCEISVSMNISSNIDYDWEIHFDHGDKIESYSCSPGDAVIYDGVKIPHWRDPLKCNENQYFHQIFFHYVNADGPYAHFAFDRV